MRKIYLFAAFIMLTFGNVAHAAEFKSGNQFELPEGQTLNTDLYVMSGNNIIRGTVNGDVFVAGGNTIISGTVNGGVFVVGGQISISGTTSGSVRAAGGSILIDGKIGKDLLASGGNIDVTSKGSVGEDVYINGRQVSISGNMKNVQANVGQLRINDSAQITGDVKYTSKTEANISSGAKINGKVVHQQVSVPETQMYASAFLGIGTIVSLVIAVLLARLFTFLFPVRSLEMAQSWREHFWVNALWGLLFVIIIPVVCIILMVTIFGIPLGLVLMLTYIVIMYVARFVTIFVAGSWLFSLIKKEEKFNLSWWPIAIGAVALAILNFVPVIGWLINAVVFLAGLGVLVNILGGSINRTKRLQQPASIL